MKPVNILLVDDHTIVREGLRKLLDLSPDLAVVGEAQDGNQAIFLAKSLQPAVILMDISMPRLNGLEATRNILKDQPTIQIIILSAHSDDAYVRQAFAVGARGFLQKQTSAHWLAEPRFRQAVERHLHREREAIAGYVEAARRHLPFQRGAGAAEDRPE